MKILILQLENFQGIKNASFKFDGKNAGIYGDNATGKTTVFNAITWLLFDRASTDAKNFTPKTRDAQGDAHNLNHAVSAQLQADDGRRISFKKTFHEVYKKKRGSAIEEFSGHTIDYCVDGVPVKEKEYTIALASICGDAQRMKLLTMPHYFSEGLSWDARREILLEMCGDTSDADVIASDNHLCDLYEYLQIPGTNQTYSVDDYKKIAAAKKADINRELQEIPGRIDEAQRAITDGEFSESDEQQMSALQAEYDRISVEKARALAGDSGLSRVREKESQIAAMMAQERAAYIENAANSNAKVNSAINELQQQIQAAQTRLNTAESIRQRHMDAMQRLTDLREHLLLQYRQVQAERWDENEAVCPTCHRALPDENVAQMHESFNLKKSKRLDDINAQGQQEASKQMIDELQKSICVQTEDFNNAKREIETLNEQMEQQRKRYKQFVPFEQTDTFAQLSVQASDCERERSEADKNAQAAIEILNTKLQTLNSRIYALRQRQTQAEQAKIQLRRISELEAREKDLSAQYEKIERGVYLCDQFTKTKVSLLTNRINSKFHSVRFRLFQEQINGGIKDDCEVMVPCEDGRLIPYTVANHAARVNAGLEIIDALSRYWGVSMPVVIDNAESITRLANTHTQLIRLVVSENDKQLRLELDDQSMAHVA